LQAGLEVNITVRRVEALVGKLSQPKHQGPLVLQMGPDLPPYRLTTHEHRLEDFFQDSGRPPTAATSKFLNLTVYPVAVLFLAFVPVAQPLHGVEARYCDQKW
jgi:hypothetical protein